MGASVGRLNYRHSRSNRQGAEIEPGNASRGPPIADQKRGLLSLVLVLVLSTLVFFDLRQTRSPTFTDTEVEGELSKR